MNGEKRHDSQRVCEKDGSDLYDGHQMAQERDCSGSVHGGGHAEAGDLAHTRIGAEDETAEVGTEARQKEIEEIDPASLPYVAMSELRYLPESNGVYFVIEEGGQVVYIGQSVNIRQRWRNHHVQPDLCDLADLEAARRIRVAWFLTPNADETGEIETLLIRRFRPRLNSSLNVGVQAAPAEQEGALLSVEQAGKRLGVCRTRVLQLIWDGLLPAEKVGRSFVLWESDVKARRMKPKLGRPPKTMKKGNGK